MRVRKGHTHRVDGCAARGPAQSQYRGKGREHSCPHRTLRCRDVSKENAQPGTDLPMLVEDVRPYACTDHPAVAPEQDQRFAQAPCRERGVTKRMEARRMPGGSNIKAETGITC